MLLTTAQMKACYKLGEMKNLEIKCIEKQLKLINEWKLPGVKIDQHVAWKSSINKIKCYARLLKKN